MSNTAQASDAAQKALETDWAQALPDKCVTCPLMEAGLCGKFQEKSREGASPEALSQAVSEQLGARGLEVREATDDQNVLILGGGNATG